MESSTHFYTICIILVSTTILLSTNGFPTQGIDKVEEEFDKEAGKECREALACNSLALQIISEIHLNLETKDYKAEEKKYLQAEKKERILSKQECESDYALCKLTALHQIGKALDVKFHFNCSTSQNFEKGQSVCNIWDFFNIYLHCEAKGDQQLLDDDDQLWMEEKCRSTKVQHDACLTQCKFSHQNKTMKYAGAAGRSLNERCYPDCVKL